MSVKNTYGIGKIVIHSDAKSYCWLGKAWYTNHFEVEIEPAKDIPDYCELDAFIAKTIEGESVIIEESVNLLYNHIVETYKPKKCKVTSRVNDAHHSAVEITKE